MILDELTEWRRYAGLLPGLDKAFEFLEKFDLTRPDGRYELDGDRVYCLVQRYKTKPVDQGVYEAHRKYTDLQFIVAGRETILWAPLTALETVRTPYVDDKDYALYESIPGSTPLRLSAGQFAILFPADGHAPCLELDGPCDVIKVVVKVRNPEM
ncbi:MAG: YhcH/YjgK/YiaL family protein [Verrucomicrobiota bacterium]